MHGFERGRTGEVKDVLRHECSHCRKEMSYNSCMFCQRGLTGVSTSRLTGTIPNSIVCTGMDMGHYCKKCYDYLKNKKCPECGSEHLDMYGIDKDPKVHWVAYRCYDCKHEWEKSYPNHIRLMAR